MDDWGSPKNNGLKTWETYQHMQKKLLYQEICKGISHGEIIFSSFSKSIFYIFISFAI